MNYDFGQVKQLYGQNRFVEAYQRTAELWRNPAFWDQIGAEELMLGRRLAFRLGGYRTYRWLMHYGRKRFAEHPLFRGHWGCLGPRKNLLEILREFYRKPSLDSGIAEYDCEWLCDNAEMLAHVRDFLEARRVLRQAREIQDGPVADEAESTILLRQDRMEEAIGFARKAWDARPGRPSAARALGGALARQGRLDEILAMFEPHARQGQSFEMTAWTCWYLCARAERSGAGQYQPYARRAEELTRRLPELAPLGDKDTRAAIANVKMDCALILGDREGLAENVTKLKSHFFTKVARNLQARPEGKFVLLPYRQAYQKHATCLPTSISAVLGAFGHEIDSDDLAQAVTYNGTPTWRAVDWLESHGYATRTFVGERSIWLALLDAGIPFVLMDMHMTWSHAVAVIGYDEAQGTLIIHDPSNERWCQALLEEMEKSETPFGPECLAIVPADRAGLLDMIPDEASRGITALNRCYKLLGDGGHPACRPVVEDLAAREAGKPITRRLEALQLAWEGNLFEAIGRQEKLLAEHPGAIGPQLDLLTSLERTRDTARIIEVQAKVVERGLVPGVNRNQPWRFPPVPYVTQYADYIGQHEEGRKKALRLLNRAMFYEPATAQLYHAMGDAYLRYGNFEQSLLPLRISAMLEITNDHYARALGDTLRHQGREEEGIEFLRWRTRELGQKVCGAKPWMCLIDALENYGRPDEAVAAMHEAEKLHALDVALQSYACLFWLRMGRQEAARAALEIAANTQGPSYLSAAVEYHRAQGRWQHALELCRQWVSREPSNIAARQDLLWLLRCGDGSLATLEVARGWTEEFRNDESFEELYHEMLKQLGESRRAEDLLRRRLDRNPLDAWSWRELGFRLASRFDATAMEDREVLQAELLATMDKVRELSGETPPRYGLLGDIHGGQGEYVAAMEAFFKALELDPDYVYPYGRIWSLAGRLPMERQKQTLARLEEFLLRRTDRLTEAGRLARAIAERWGIQEAEAAVQRWQSRRGEDPELIAAQAELWLSYGRGQSDAQRAVELLTPAVERFVNHFGLRFLLARAYAVLMQEPMEIQSFEEILRRQPLNVQARYSLAMTHARNGRVEKALELVKQGPLLSPANGEAYDAAADVMEYLGRPEEALQTVLEGTKYMPERMELWERAIHLLHQLRRFDEALRVSRRLTELFHEGAYAWNLHAVALGEGATASDFLARENALRKALSLNASLWSSAYNLSILLVQQHRFDDARAVIERQMQMFEDVSNHRAQLACILWWEGKNRQAIDAMAAMLAVWPKTAWAWGKLLDWIEARTDWEMAKTILQDVPAAMESSAEFRTRRLVVLQAAGWKEDRLNPLWKELLDNFPAHQDVHLCRFDMLWNDNRFDEARRVLDHIQRLHPNSEFVLARRVHVTFQENPSRAVEDAMTLWTNLREQSTWPAQHAWKVMEHPSSVELAIKRMYDWLAQGKPIRRSAMEGFLRNIHRSRFKKSIGDCFSFSGSPAKRACIRALTHLMDVLGEHRWDDGLCRAQMLTVLCGLSKPLARDYFFGNPSCQEQTPVWAEGCRLFLDSSRKLLARWREHKDVEMFTVANYTLGIRQSYRQNKKIDDADLDEMAASARDALATLVHDSTPKYLACTLCESLLRRGRHAEFLAAMEQYRPLIFSRNTQFWMSGHESLPDILRHFETLLQSENFQEYRNASDAFFKCHPRYPMWSRLLWCELIRPRMGFWRSVWYNFLMM